MYPNIQANDILQKIPARSFTVETMLELYPNHIGEEAGLVVRGQTYFMLGIRFDGTTHRIVLHADKTEEILIESVSHAVKFRVHFRDGGICSFAYSTNRGFVEVPGTFQAQKGTWIGAKVGLYSVNNNPDVTSGHVDVDYFRFKECQ
jgi:hypothetical protein